NRALADERTNYRVDARTRSRSITQSRSINRKPICAKRIQPISVNVSVAPLNERDTFPGKRMMMGQRRKETSNSELSWPSTFIPVVSQPLSGCSAFGCLLPIFLLIVFFLSYSFFLIRCLAPQCNVAAVCFCGGLAIFL